MSDILSSLRALQAACGNGVLLVCTGESGAAQRAADVLTRVGVPFERAGVLFVFPESV